MNPAFNKVANLLIVIGTVLQTLTVAGLSFGSMHWFALPIHRLGLTMGIIALIFAWIAYSKARQFSLSWTIYGLVQSLLFGGWIATIGYVFALIDFDLTAAPATNPQPTPAPQTNNIDEEIAAIRRQINDLERQRDTQK